MAAPNPGINALPTEILASVLIHSCTEAFYDLDRQFNYDITGMKPLSRTLASLRLVSARWDAVALSTPELWTRLRIVVLNTFQVSPPLPVLACWLERSASAPLNVTFAFHNRDWDDACYQQLVGVCFPSIARWTSLRFDGVGHQGKLLIDFPFDDALSLQSLEIPDRTVSSHQWTEHVVPRMLGLRTLRNLKLKFIDHDMARACSRILPPILKNLTTLDVFCFEKSWTRVWEMIGHCTSATHLSVKLRHSIDTEVNENIPISEITLPLLQHLKINIVVRKPRDVSLIPVPSYVRLPNLQSLFLRPTYYHPFSIMDTISRFLSSSSISKCFHSLRIFRVHVADVETLLDHQAVAALPTVFLYVEARDPDFTTFKALIQKWARTGCSFSLKPELGEPGIYRVGWDR